MEHFVALAVANLTSPMVLCFALGVIAALARSDLSIPEAVAKGMSIYLLFAIGFKGGMEVARHGLTPELVKVLSLGLVLSILIPVVGFYLLRMTTKLSAINAAAVCAHYGSISIVTFVAATQALKSSGIAFDSALVAVAAVMEAPAIICALFLLRRHQKKEPEVASPARRKMSDAMPLREVFLNGSIVLLAGAFLIGLISGETGFEMIKSFIHEPFKGVLCLFLLDMGLLAGRHLKEGLKHLTVSVISFGLYMPLISAALCLLLAAPMGIQAGSLALLITLAASASYIAVPAALRIALPKANPAIYITLSLAVTFPFNLTIGIPIYIALAEFLS